MIKLSRALMESVAAGSAEDGKWLKSAFPRLAPFLLAGPPPRFRIGVGRVHVFLAVKNAGAVSPFRPAPVLPLFWAKGRQSPELPEGLAELSRNVAGNAELKEIAGEGADIDGWALQPDFPYDISDWDDFIQTWDSAWGALAGGLTLARLSLRAQPDVAISAAWGEGGLIPVEETRKKTISAKQAGVRHLFLPDADIDEIRAEFGDENFFPHSIPFNKPLRETFAEFFYRLEVAPSLDDSGDAEQLKRCVRYAIRNQAALGDKGLDFYAAKNIVPGRAVRLRGEAGDARADHLAILASKASAALLSIMVLRPKTVVLLHTERDKDLPDAVGKLLPPDMDGRVRIDAEMVDVGRVGDIEGKLAAWSANPGEKTLDVTGLTKLATAAAVLGCSGADVSIMAVQTDNPRSRGGYLPGEERIIWIGSGRGLRREKNGRVFDIRKK